MSTLAVGQLIVFGFEEPTLDEVSCELLEKRQAGGVIVFKRNIVSLEQVVALNSSVIQACASSLPPFICVDQEGGRVQRLKDICTHIPNMRVIGELATQHPKLPYQLGAMMGRELTALGFNLDCAPVLDVDTNPDNPVIGERSFSRDAHSVARIGAQFIQGLQDSGIAACGKHFPGHGDTDTDSHLALPLIPHDIKRLQAIELLPFEAAIKAHVASLMTAHIMVPALDKSHPATLSHAILTTLLRHQLGYQGLIVSDDLNMAAVANHYELKEMLIKGVQAGVDVFLICKDPHKAKAAIDILEQAVENGELDITLLEAALKRIENVKQRYIGAVAPPNIDYARQIVKSEPHLALAKHWEGHTASSYRPTSLVDIS